MAQAAATKEQVLAHIKRQRGGWVDSAALSRRLGCTVGAATKHLRLRYREGLLLRRPSNGQKFEYRSLLEGESITAYRGRTTGPTAYVAPAKG